MLNAELKVISGKQAGSVIPLATGRFLIGREEDCHLRPSNDLVSRHHCVFKKDEYTVRIRDLGSTNGTFVNGERLRGEVMLNTGDQVKVGTLEFEVLIGESADAAADQQPQVGATIEGEPDMSQTMIDVPAAAQPDSVPDAALHETTAFQGETIYQRPTPPPGFDPNQQQFGYGQMPIGYQMPYPQQPYMYGQPYGMPMGYPQQPMPYPMYQQPQMPMPQQQPPPAPEGPAPTSNNSRSTPGVVLPDPTQTGAKTPEAAAPASGQSGEKAIGDKVSDIIKQYTQRRPGAKK